MIHSSNDQRHQTSKEVELVSILSPSSIVCQHKNYLSAANFNTYPPLDSTITISPPNSVEKSANAVPTTIHMECHSINNILPTAIIKVRSRCGNEILARVLLDSGFQSNFVTESFVKQLRLAREKLNIQIHSVGSILNDNTRDKNRLQINSLCHSFSLWRFYLELNSFSKLFKMES